MSSASRAEVAGEVMPNSAKGPNAVRLHLFDWIDRASQPDRRDTAENAGFSQDKSQKHMQTSRP
jgi:hypothetical protein